jgi:hypothetical protein
VDEQLRRLSAFLPRLEDPAFVFGEWRGGERRNDGSFTMPYFEFSREALDLLAAMPVKMGFDWPNWMGTDEARGLREDRGAIATATPEQLGRLATAIVRGDRFTEGNIAATFESGLLTAIVRRAAALSEAPEN